MVRSKFLFAAAVALATASFVHAADPATYQAAAPVDAYEIALPAPVVTLKALFAKPASAEVIEVQDGVAVGMDATEVLVARRNTDGSVVTACVDSEQAARAFLDTPVEKVATKQAKEQ